MYEYISGNIEYLSPTLAILDNHGIGYQIQISLFTYTALKQGQADKLLLYQIIREDAHILFGFKTADERDMFKLLIGVNGIGANTARMMLSSLSPAELRQAIFTDNISLLKTIKGIGLKTAQRVIIELKDKISKTDGASSLSMPMVSTGRSEAISALIMLGFAKPEVEKTIDKLLSTEPSLSIENLIKKALKAL